MAGERRVIAHLVHGTWPSGGFLRHNFQRLFRPLPVWSEPGSDFCRALAARVPGIEFRPFRWSGENLETDRRKAAAEFAEVLRKGGEGAMACQVIVAHSHGGNVALWALGLLSDQERAAIHGLATLGTPFLEFHPRRLTENEESYIRALRGPWLMRFAWFGTIACIPWILFGPLPDVQPFERWFLAAALLVGAPLFRAALREVRRRVPLPSGAPLTGPRTLTSFLALRAPADEASRAINFADAIARALRFYWLVVRWYARLTPWARPGRQVQSLRKAAPIALPVLAVLYTILVVGFAFAPQELHQELPGLDFPRLAVLWFVLFFGGFLASVSLVWAFGVLLASSAEAYPRLLLTWAFGPDAALLSSGMEITAEAVPTKPRAMLEMLPVMGHAEARHSLHAMAGARDRIADWILERRDAASRPTDR